LSISIRILVTAGLFALLVSRIDVSQALHVVSEMSVLRFVFAACLFAAIAPLNAVRWSIVLSSERAAPPLRTLLGILLVGLFFNQVLPTGVGGDAIRAWRLHKFGFDPGVCVRSILLERAAGYSVFVLLYDFSLLYLLGTVTDEKQRWALIAVAVITTSGIIALLFINFVPALGRIPLASPIARLSRQAWVLCTSPRRLGAILALSGASASLAILATKVLADGLDVRLSYSTWLLILPPVALVQLAPISLAGWGVRETALVAMLTIFDVPPANALATSLLVGLSLILNALPGGIVWLTKADIAVSDRPPQRSSSNSGDAQSFLRSSPEDVGA
jgi:uncharacterized membrane protein YbhN (UPF0104 family)